MGHLRGVVAGATVVVGAGVAAYLHANVTGLRKGMAAVAAAGFEEKRATVGGVTPAYAEGPATARRSCSCTGRAAGGRTTSGCCPRSPTTTTCSPSTSRGTAARTGWSPGRYTKGQVAALIAGFVDEVVGGRVLLSGHSSGGLLALNVAAYRPELVRGLHLEDPPLFSSQMPRLPRTVGGDLVARARDWLAAGEPGGFERYYVEHGRYFAFFGPLEEPIRRYALRWIDRHPGEPLLIGFLPTLVNVFFPGIVHYDPAFGAQWVRETGGWYSDFDTEAALRAVTAPTGVIHTNFVEARSGSAYGADGVLKAAMDSSDLARALDLLPDGTELLQLRCGHLVHVERPDDVVASIRRVTARVPVGG